MSIDNAIDHPPGGPLEYRTTPPNRKKHAPFGHCFYSICIQGLDQELMPLNWAYVAGLFAARPRGMIFDPGPSYVPLRRAARTC